VNELLKSLATVRRRGWAESLEEAVPGVGSTSIAVEDSGDHEMVGLCLTYSASVQRAKRNEMAQLLVKAGHTLGLQIGDPFWTALADGKATNGKSL
jgi:DNA-binding IclR family transcriptional regulator